MLPLNKYVTFSKEKLSYRQLKSLSLLKLALSVNLSPLEKEKRLDDLFTVLSAFPLNLQHIPKNYPLELFFSDVLKLDEFLGIAISNMITFDDNLTVVTPQSIERLIFSINRPSNPMSRAFDNSESFQNRFNQISRDKSLSLFPLPSNQFLKTNTSQMLKSRKLREKQMESPLYAKIYTFIEKMGFDLDRMPVGFPSKMIFLKFSLEPKDQNEILNGLNITLEALSDDMKETITNFIFSENPSREAVKRFRDYINQEIYNEAPKSDDWVMLRTPIEEKKMRYK